MQAIAQLAGQGARAGGGWILLEFRFAVEQARNARVARVAHVRQAFGRVHHVLQRRRRFNNVVDQILM